MITRHAVDCKPLSGLVQCSHQLNDLGTEANHEQVFAGTNDDLWSIAFELGFQVQSTGECHS